MSTLNPSVSDDAPSATGSLRFRQRAKNYCLHSVLEAAEDGASTTGSKCSIRSNCGKHDSAGRDTGDSGDERSSLHRFSPYYARLGCRGARARHPASEI